MAVAGPVGPGCDDDLVRAVAQHVVGRQPRLGMDFDILELVELDLAVGHHAAPLGETRVALNILHAAADFGIGLDEMDLEPTHAEHPGTFHARRTRSDDEHRRLLRRLLEFLGMPAAAVFLHRGGVLGADKRRAADLPARDAHVAADAFADIVEPPLLDLLGQEGIGNRGPCCTDDVGLTRLENLDHVVGTGDAPDGQHGHVGHIPDALDPGPLVVRLVETRRPRILTPFGDIRDVDVPQVGQPLSGDDLDELHAVLAHLDAGRSDDGVDGEAGNNAAIRADGGFHALEAFEPETGTVLDVAAILVGALVVVLGEELQRQIAVRTIDVNQIEAGLLGALGAFDIHLDELLDVVLVGLVGIGPVFEVRRKGRRTHGHMAGVHAGRMGATVPHFAAYQRPVFVAAIGQMAEIDDVALVPQPRMHARRIVGIGIDRAVFGAHGAPAALGAHRAIRCLATGLVRARTNAVRHHEKAVLHRFRPDLDGLKQNVVFRIACHEVSSLPGWVRYPASPSVFICLPGPPGG